MPSNTHYVLRIRIVFTLCLGAKSDASGWIQLDPTWTGNLTGTCPLHQMILKFTWKREPLEVSDGHCSIVLGNIESTQLNKRLSGPMASGGVADKGGITSDCSLENVKTLE